MLTEIADGRIKSIGLDQNGIPLYIVEVRAEVGSLRLLISFREAKRSEVKNGRRRKRKTTFALVRIKSLNALAIADEWYQNHSPTETLLGDLPTVKLIEMKMPTAGTRSWLKSA
ncbi:hypothetical protein HQ524_02985 [Candidatus Uhrbacteria bacterium]|nr:hypothetical protein [Candidatus Uhrbacteria bacterium]